VTPTHFGLEPFGQFCVAVYQRVELLLGRLVREIFHSRFPIQIIGVSRCMLCQLNVAKPLHSLRQRLTLREGHQSDRENTEMTFRSTYAKELATVIMARHVFQDVVLARPFLSFNPEHCSGDY